MDTEREARRDEVIEENPNFGGASAGAQNGGIIDTGVADNETEYSDAIAGRTHVETDEGEAAPVAPLEEPASGIGSTGDMTTVGTDRGMPGTWTGGTSTSNSSGL